MVPSFALRLHVPAQDRVRVPGNTHCRLLGCVGFHVGKDGRVGNRLNKARAKDRSRDSENNVAIPALASEGISRGPEVKLRDVATGGVASSGDHEKVVHVAVWDTVAFLEARFADRTIVRDEPRNRVLCSSQVSNVGEGVFRGARSAHTRLRVPRKALVGVEAWTETIVRASLHDLDFSEPALPVLEERRLSAVRPFNGPPAAGGPPRTPGSTGVDLVWHKLQTHVIKATVNIPLNLLGRILPNIIITSPHCLYRNIANAGTGILWGSQAGGPEL